MKNNWFKTYEDKLFLRIDRSITSLINHWWEYELGILSPYDRKRIHSYIAKNYDNIVSKSRWEWKNRKMFLYVDQKIKSKQKKIVSKKLSIDIDWYWI